MDPLQKYGAYSYVDVMLSPLAAALAATGTSDTQVLFGMQVRPSCSAGKGCPCYACRAVAPGSRHNPAGAAPCHAKHRAVMHPRPSLIRRPPPANKCACWVVR